MEQLIHSGDHWVVLISFVSIVMLASRKARLLGIVGMLATTAYIERNYSIWRALLHVLLMILFVYITRISLQKLAYAYVDNHKQ